jgi:hypothetical protein
MTEITTGAPAPSIESFSVFNTANIIYTLWERVADGLTADELKWFAQATGEAERATRNLIEVVEGIGCLIAGDDGNIGNFQSKEDVPTLLFHIGHSLDHISMMAYIGGSAAYRLGHPDLYRELAEARAFKELKRGAA